VTLGLTVNDPNGDSTGSEIRDQGTPEVAVNVMREKDRRSMTAPSTALKPQVVVSHFLSRAACFRSSMSEGSETVVGVTAILGYARV